MAVVRWKKPASGYLGGIGLELKLYDEMYRSI